MSDDFANLIGKALNTPPTGTIKLVLGELVELKNMDGRLIKPVSLTLDLKVESVLNFQIVVQVNQSVNGGVNSKPFSCLPMSSEIFKGYFSEQAAVKTNSNDLIYIELKTILGVVTKAKTAILEYSYGTPY